MKQQKIVEKTKYAYEENDCPCICHDGDFTEDCVGLCEGCFNNPEEVNKIVEKGKIEISKQGNRLIMFRFEPTTSRTSADCGDIVNWLLDKNPELAGEFETKYKEAEKFIKETIDLRQGKKAV
jgi:hypothetical protein